jgi:mRNA (guanine-N7-)-methyltransferase
MYFDISSCQFSMHYMFDTEAKVRNFLQNATDRLVHGGYFICTHPDANVIVKKLRNASVTDEQGRHVTENKYYSIISDTVDFPKDKGPFGFPYGFFLTDNLVGFKEPAEPNKKGNLHYVPEFLVIVPSLQKIAAEYGLELVESKNLHEYFSENINKRQHYDLFSKRMKFTVEEGAHFLLDRDLWDVSYLYR